MMVGSSTNKYMEIYGNIWKYMEIYGNIWKYMEMKDDLMLINGDNVDFMVI
jgi:predicted phosphohydrolase